MLDSNRRTDESKLDMVAVLSETTAGPFLSRLRTRMLATPSGRNLLREKPRITEESINLKKLESMKEGTFGREYARWLKMNKVTPNTRDPVRHLSPNPESRILKTDTFLLT